MPADIHFVINYFSEEKISNLIVIITGITSLAFALIFLLIIKYSFFKGMAIPLLFFGILQIAVGSTVYMRTTKDVFKIEQDFNQDPEKTKLSELSRTETVINNFHLYQCIEIVLIIIGLILYIKFHRSSLTFWKGLGLGLLIQAGITLTIDTVAEKRVEQYVHYLNE